MEVLRFNFFWLDWMKKFSKFFLIIISWWRSFLIFFESWYHDDISSNQSKEIKMTKKWQSSNFYFEMNLNQVCPIPVGGKMNNQCSWLTNLYKFFCCPDLSELKISADFTNFSNRHFVQTFSKTAPPLKK